MLANPRSRYVAYHLLEAETAHLDELAEHVAAEEYEASPPEDLTEAVRADLYHNHLPKLADVDGIEYDERSGAVRWRDPPAHFEELVEFARDLDATD